MTGEGLDWRRTLWRALRILICFAHWIPECRRKKKEENRGRVDDRVGSMANLQ
ncbi:hypothetical protein BDW69DRAFT_155215 [Aspergillus filifer]